MKKKQMSGFTLVELLAVIVILAIILVIAVPKVLNVINDSKKATIESAAKVIAGTAEKTKLQNQILGNYKEINCEDIAKINDVDYESCSIEFDGNTAKVTIEGKGKFNGLWVCEGTKTSALAQKEGCSVPIEVVHPLFIAGQSLTPDKFEVTLTESDGSTVKLWPGGMKVDETKEATIITSPNWPNNYNDSMTESENYWEATYEGAEEILITFDATSETETVDYDWIAIYDKDGIEKYRLGGNNFAGQTYVITGDYVKVTMKTDSIVNSKGFSATIKPANNAPAEYTISPSTVPSTEGNFDITITVNGQNMRKKITTRTVHKIKDYVASHKGFDTVQTNATYNSITYDAGIRYTGDNPNNKVYFNCEEKDKNNVSYGETGYLYDESCETWRIIGVFNTKSSISSDAVPRVKLINTESTFMSSWDTSASTVNGGFGVNQWGESGDYLGADLMQFLNGYYIGAENSTCTYCSYVDRDICSQTCTKQSLTSDNLKPLTTKAKRMIGNAVWDTYAVASTSSGGANSSWAPTAYLEEKGISAQYTGISECLSCSDGVTRTTNWTGLVGLMSISDITYANGWLYNEINNLLYPWSITPNADPGYAFFVWSDRDSFDGSKVVADRTDRNYSVWSSVYLNSDIQIIGGDGDTVPYKLR